MRAYPFLKLTDVTPDPELVGHVPHALASYYMALPLAREDGRVSVAMVHPENAAAVTILSRLLGGTVVPVRSAAEAIRGALQTFALSEPAPAPCILGWTTRSEGVPTVKAWTTMVADLLGVAARVELSTPEALEDINAAASTQRYQLTVLDVPRAILVERVLPAATGPVLYVRGCKARPLRRILIVLRGFSSDEVALQWAVSLADSGEATLTLMSLTGVPSGAWSVTANELRAGPGSCQDSLLTFGRRPDARNLRLYRKVRQGDPVQQISDEAVDCVYDLIVICAEGDGAFVGRALAGLEKHSNNDDCPVLIVRPAL